MAKKPSKRATIKSLDQYTRHEDGEDTTSGNIITRSMDSESNRNRRRLIGRDKKTLSISDTGEAKIDHNMRKKHASEERAIAKINRNLKKRFPIKKKKGK